MMRKVGKPLAYLLLAVIVLLASACQPDGPPDMPDPNLTPGAPIPTALPTRAIAVRSVVVTDGVLVLGTPAIALSFETSARVTAVNVTPGQRVKKGAVLATVDEAALRDALTDAKAQLELVEAQIAQGATPPRPEDIESAKATLSAAYTNYSKVKAGPTAEEIEQARLSWEAARESAQASKWTRDAECGDTPDSAICKSQDGSYGSAYEGERAEYARYQALLQPVSQEQLAQAYAQVASAEARLNELQAGQTEEQKRLAQVQLEQARANVVRAEKDLARAKLISPCDCAVQEVNVVVGAVTSGAAVTLLDLNDLQFKTTNLTERDLMSVRVGTAATIRLKAYGQPFIGQVSALLPVAEQSGASPSGEARFTVLINVEPDGFELLPGMTGQAEIEVQE